MKKVFLTLIAVTLVAGLFAQQINRERVVVEIATGTWCQFCPGAAMGADDLVANGHDVAIIEYHNGDAFANAFSNHRNSYYSVTGYPTAHFDGVLEQSGGSTSTSMYSSYLPLYNQRIAIPCDYEASIYGENTGGLNYDVTVIIDLLNGTPPANLTAHLVLTESEIVYSWQGLNELNYVCRAMYPNQYGTTVSFSGGNQMIINYTFSIDATWNTQHIELVAFMQDESTKEILQGSMVPIENLISLNASASFSCSNQQPCETTSVDFFDNSLGLITTWNWSFEGGTPATSTAQNPSVTYNSPGVYDVQLIVDDGSVIDTLLMEDYIEAITTPVQANTPSGPADLCGGYSGYTYTTNAVANATTYTWAIDPASAGTVTANGTSATVDIDPAYSGNLDIKVRADNQCGTGVWSQAYTATVFYTPTQYWISDGAAYCAGTQGVEVTLDGSEAGVDYELILDGTGTGNIMAGTGNLLNFGYQTDEGIYTITGYTDHCEAIMYGNAYIHEIDIPGAAATPEGDELVCTGEESAYTTSGASGAGQYVWTLTPVEAGTITGNSPEAVVLWSDSYEGAASIIVYGTNDCGDGPVSDALEIDVNTSPQPVIEGDDLVCENTGGYVYSSEDHAQASYNWSVVGGTITTGQGTHQITVTWGDMGTAYVNLSEVSASDCEGIAAEFVVTVDECVGIDERFMNKISLYPNPANEILNIEFYALQSAKLNVQVLNRLGQLVINNAEYIMTGNNNISLNTSSLPNGYYTLKLIAGDGVVVQEKFIIIK